MQVFCVLKRMNKRTPLCAASERGDVEAVRWLLQRPCIDIEGSDGEYEDLPLTLAAFWGHSNIVKILISCKADIEGTNIQGDTPLMLAARQGHFIIVEFLVLNCKAKVSAKNCTG